MVKVAGRSTGADGNLYTDSYYEENIQGALAAGMQVGAYFFSQSMSVEEAVEEANYICDLIAGYNITILLYLTGRQHQVIEQKIYAAIVSFVLL